MDGYTIHDWAPTLENVGAQKHIMNAVCIMFLTQPRTFGEWV